MTRPDTSGPRSVVSARVRALLATGIVLGLGSVGTLATWSDDAAVGTGTISSGALDLLLNNELTGQGGTVTSTELGRGTLGPGSTAADVVTVRNGGSVPFTYSVNATATGTLAPQLRWIVRQNGTVSGTTCTGGTIVSNSVAWSATATSVAAGVALTPGQTRSYCVQVTLPTTAPSSVQGTAAAAVMTFSAGQS